jgi:hypothetical protein
MICCGAEANVKSYCDTGHLGNEHASTGAPAGSRGRYLRRSRGPCPKRSMRGILPAAHAVAKTGIWGIASDQPAFEQRPSLRHYGDHRRHRRYGDMEPIQLCQLLRKSAKRVASAGIRGGPDAIAVVVARSWRGRRRCCSPRWCRGWCRRWCWGWDCCPRRWPGPGQAGRPGAAQRLQPAACRRDAVRLDRGGVRHPRERSSADARRHRCAS